MATENFANSLLVWFNVNQRHLPWRSTKDPYTIWLSEVILQQTRVAQGLPYFERFIGKYPTVQHLATADEEDVLKLWQGLGYYSRARNMLKTAKQIVEGGNPFPNSYSKLIELKGIGEYTASAISSFSSNERVAVVDGNVYRVLSRYFGIREPIDTSVGKKAFKELSINLLPKNHTDQYNQAIMEFGALQCKPKNPNCETCPFTAECKAFRDGMVGELPIKSKKQKKRKVELHYLVIHSNDDILFRKRKGLGVWEGLFDFPSIETESIIEPNQIIEMAKKHLDLSYLSLSRNSRSYKHVLSHIEYKAHFWEGKINKPSIQLLNHFWINIDDISELPVSRLVEKYLNSKIL